MGFKDSSWNIYMSSFVILVASGFEILGGKERKGKEEYLYSAVLYTIYTQSAQAWITQFYLQIHYACLSFVSVHQMAPPITEVVDIQLQLTTHLSTPKG